MDHDSDMVSEQAATALLRLGDDTPLQRAVLAAQAKTWPRRILGIAGDARSVNVLLDVLQGKRADGTAALALGILGDLRAVAPLVAALEDDSIGDAAAVALNTITGAGLQDDVFIPAEFDPDELFDEERRRFEKDGTLPTRANGEPYGNWERRPEKDPHVWREWLGANKSRFSRDLRWRMGKPYGPDALLDCLRSDLSPFEIRSASYDELVVRYGLDVPFEADLPVQQQVRFISSMDAWAAAASGRFSPGQWYFAGQVQQ